MKDKEISHAGLISNNLFTESEIFTGKSQINRFRFRSDRALAIRPNVRGK